MTKIKCPWDLCTHNTRCHDNVEPECSKENIELIPFSDKSQLLKCKDFKYPYSLTKKSRRLLNNE